MNNKRNQNFNFNSFKTKNYFFNKKIFTNYFLSKNKNKEINFFFNFFLQNSKETKIESSNKKISTLNKPILINDLKKINKNLNEDSLQLTQNETLLNTNDFISQRSIEDFIQLNENIKENSNKIINKKNNFKSNKQLLNFKNKLHYSEFHRRIKSFTQKNLVKINI